MTYNPYGADPFRFKIQRYETVDHFVLYLPTDGPFQVVVEGEYIIGAILGQFILYPFLDHSRGEFYRRVKVHKHTLHYVDISPGLVPESQMDPVTRKFWERYDNMDNMYLAEVELEHVHWDVLRTLSLARFSGFHLKK